jgi:pantoate kinase
MIDNHCIMNKVIAFSPGHVTGLFFMKDLADDPLKRGSLGSGFSLKKGAFTTVSFNKNIKDLTVSINREKNIDAPVSRKVVELFHEWSDVPFQGVDIRHYIETPQGSGFGSSGSGALSLVYALNRLYNDPLSAIKISQIAHVAEVLCRTGLGTVMGETMGGFKVLVEPGAPGIGKTISVSYPKGLYAAFIVFGPYSTSEALSNPKVRESIMESGRKYHSLIKENPEFERFMEYSRAFAESTGIIPMSVRKILDELDLRGIKSSMLMFGEGTFSIQM